MICFAILLFQSTLPARGATFVPNNRTINDEGFQSTLPARGATTTAPKELLRAVVFQSTLPARGATFDDDRSVVVGIFQSTLPARGATTATASSCARNGHFNPRSPHGERLIIVV